MRRVAIAIGVLVVVICAVRAISKPTDGDFKLHWGFGQSFLAGEFLYARGHHLGYPPFWAMAHAPLALLPLPIAKAVLLPLGLAALGALLLILRRLASPSFDLTPPQVFWTAAVALILASRYVIRDIAEVGVNTSLVLLTWLAICLWRNNREVLAATSLGGAIALKCTPMLFAAFFLWKRQWRMAALTAAATACFTLAPVLWQGPISYTEHMRTWLANAWQATASGDPGEVMLGAEPVRNMSLGATLAGYLAGRPPTLRRAFIKVTLVALVGIVMWWSRRRPTNRDDPRLLWEFSAVGIVMLLVSPITWGQHCVALLPACYFLAALFVSHRHPPRSLWVLVGIYVFLVLALSRDLLGKDLALRVGSYHVETFAMLALLAAVIAGRRLHTARTSALG
ncbi:MAG TPA: glycosyltransferase family 87 protein [Chthoniobacterales bacterium]